MYKVPKLAVSTPNICQLCERAPFVLQRFTPPTGSRILTFSVGWGLKAAKPLGRAAKVDTFGNHNSTELFITQGMRAATCFITMQNTFFIARQNAYSLHTALP